MHDRQFKIGSALLCALMLAACVTKSAEDSDPPNFLGSGAGYLTPGKPSEHGRGPIAGDLRDQRRGFSELSTGAIGRVSGAGSRASLGEDGRTVSLNFADTDVQEFVRVVFDEVLKESAIVDPSVAGKITVRTVQPISRAAALDLIRNVLEMNGASLTKAGAVYRVGKTDAGGRRSGLAMRAFALSHIDAEQAKGAVQSLAGEGTQIFANKGGRFLMASGAPADLDAVEQALASLDVDQLAGMSFALMPLQEASAQAVANEVAQMFGASASLKALPIQRMNAVLLVGRTAASVERAKGWIRRLDQGGHDGRRVFVYAVQNRRAKDIAQVLNGMLGRSGGGGRPSEARDSPVAPSVKPAAAATDGFANPPVDQVFDTVSAADASDRPPGPGMAAADPGSGPLTRSDVAVSADLSTNSLVIIAKPEDYQLVEAAIRRLDVQPAQVLIEATIFEVQLNDTLRHGVRWYFEQGNHAALLTENGRNAGGPAAGFNYIFQVPKAKVVLNALEAMTKLEVISSPALTVLDNQTATLKVGDQVPIATRASQSVAGGNGEAPLINEIEMKDTGIILSVTPRVNAGGLVQLDIAQEVSDVVKTTSSDINSPTIRQRSVNSSVAVHSGAEIILGGLISRRREEGRAGLPVLKDIPVLGEAFTTNALRENSRNELLIIIRPVVMANKTDVYAVTQEIKARMSGIAKMQPKPLAARY